jgi:hypothetical protein
VIKYLKGAPAGNRLFYAAIVFHVAVALALILPSGYSFDIAGLTGPAERFLRWGETPFYNWKLGADVNLLALLDVSERFLLQEGGVSAIAAAHLAWKLPLVLADILGAFALRRIARRFLPDTAAIIGAAWLLNPAVIWVSAVHGQIESVSMASVFWAVEFAFSGRWFLCGLIAGLGTGVEYFPLIGIVVPIFAAVRRTITVRSLVASITGLIVALLACFAPLLLSAVARDGVVQGLGSTASANAVPLYSLDIWWPLGITHMDRWPLIFAGFSIIACFCIGLMRSLRWERASISCISIVLAAAVLLDQNAMGQFSVVVAGALLLLACNFWMPLPAVSLISLAGILGYLCAVGLAPFWFDGYQGTVSVPWFPQLSASLVTPFVALFSFGSVLLIAGAMTLRKVHYTRASAIAVQSIAVACFAVLLAFSLQPALWTNVVSATAYDLADFVQFHQNQDGVLLHRRNGSLVAIMPPALKAAISSLPYHHTLSISGSAVLLFQNESASASAFRSKQIIDIPAWPQWRAEVKTTRWFVLLYRPPGDSHLRLAVNGCVESPEQRRQVSAQLYIVSFTVPAKCLGGGSQITYRLLPQDTLWVGDVSGGWLDVAIADATFQAQVNGARRSLLLRTDMNKQASLMGLPDVSTITIDPSPALEEIFEPRRFLVSWPPLSFLYKRTALILGAVWIALQLLGAGILLWRLIRNAQDRVRDGQYFKSELDQRGAV